MKIPRILKNRMVVIGAAVLLVIVIMAAWPKSQPAELAAVQRGPMRVTVDEEGETRVRARFVISAPVAGRVLRIDLEPGDAVARGRTLLATFLPGAPNLLDARARAEAEAGVKAAEAALGRAQAERSSARAALDLARSTLERNRRLAQERIVSRETLESQEAAARAADEGLRAAEFAVAGAEHELSMARARLLTSSNPVAAGGKSIRIVSPIDGVVLKRLRESEAVVPAGEPLLELGDPRRLEIVSDLLSNDAVMVRPGAAAFIERWGGEETLRARVRRVEPSGFMKISALGVEEQRVNVIMDFEDPAEAHDALGDGYRVEVRIIVWESEDVLKAPTSALFRRGEDWSAFVHEKGRARLRSVEVGRRNGLEAQILSGVEAGEKVVIHPSDSLEDGARVTPQSS
ncbi:MAG: HlyD family efflux transporter periplasmic adaptor subunit [Vicinamibacteria bacterium]|nr:HlyD family efflux transporter periplasmic adaptor subunit [Vicinamibacteria bacterium]